MGLDGGVNTYSYAGANPLNYFDEFGLFPSIFDCFDPEGIDAIFDSLHDAKDQRYYKCLRDCLVLDSLYSPVIGTVIESAGTSFLERSNIPERSVGKYFQRIKKDRRFTRGGLRSRVLVPRGAKRIRFLLKGVSVLGFSLFYKDIYKCTQKCLQ
jgi:hypothetical protein